MSLYVLAGPLLNHVVRAAAAPTFSPTADTNFPAANCCDNRSNFPAYWSSSSSDATATVDISLVPDPGAESGTSSWSYDSNIVVAQSSAAQNSGTYSASLTSTGSSGSAYQDISVKPGESISLTWAIYAVSTSAPAALWLQNRHTGNYLTSGGTWTASSTTIAYQATASSWSTGSLTFSVESLATALADPCTIRLSVSISSGGTVYADDLEMVPITDWCSVHGHNFTPIVKPQLLYSTDNSNWTTQSTMTAVRDSFYTALSSGIYARYWRLKLSGTPSEPPYVGEWILGKYQAVTVGPQYGAELDLLESQVRMTGPDGGQWVYSRGGSPVRRLNFSFIYDSSSAYTEARDQVYRASRGGLYPLVIAPTDLDSDLCIFGRIRESASYVKETYTLRSAGWEITEDALPNVAYTS